MNPFQSVPPKMADAGRQSVEDGIDEVLRMDGEGAGELLLVRHAEAARGDNPDPMLTCLGLTQAERLADRLSTMLVDAVYSAPERRAQQTARIVASASGQDVQVLEGVADIAFDPHAQTTVDIEEQVARFSEMPRWDCLDGFEGSRQFRRRAILSIEGVLACHAGRRVVVVTHSAVINAYLSMLLSVPADAFFTAEPASVSVVRWQEGCYALRSLNDLSHLWMEPGITTRSELFTRRSLPLTTR